MAFCGLLRRCDMVHCAYLSLPLPLEKAGSVLKVEQQKMKEGKDLMKYFVFRANRPKPMAEEAETFREIEKNGSSSKPTTSEM